MSCAYSFLQIPCSKSWHDHLQIRKPVLRSAELPQNRSRGNVLLPGATGTSDRGLADQPEYDEKVEQIFPVNGLVEQLELAEVEAPTPAPILRSPLHYEIALLIVAVIIFFGCIVSPPGLMDDVDAVHGQIARNMVDSGDWVIPHLDGVPYMEKAPLPYWLIAICYLVLGVHDWVARIPTALAAVLLCFATARYGAWAFGRRAGFYAGLALATSAGLFLFTRILIPDVMLALTVCLGFMAFQRALNEDGEELHRADGPRFSAFLLDWVCCSKV